MSSAIGGIGLALIFFLTGCWADGWDFSVFNILQGGMAEFTWRSVVATLSYGVSASIFGFSLGEMRFARLKAEGKDPNMTAEIDIVPTESYGATSLVAVLLFWLSIPAAIALCIWQYTAS